MPHEYPRVALRGEETPDARTLSRLITTVADKVAGGLNEHDTYSGAKFTVAQVAVDAYYKVHRVYNACDPRWQVAAGLYASQDSGGDTATVRDDSVWDVLRHDTDRTEISLSLRTGEEIFFAIGQAQLISFTNDSATPDTPSASPERTQLAIRFDGGVIAETITGALAMPDMPAQEIYRQARAALPLTFDYDFRHRFWQEDTVGINTNVAAVRVMYAWPVAEGDHTVDLVARRLPYAEFKPDNAGMGSTVQAFNRQLVVLRLRGWAKGDGSESVLQVDPYHDGDGFPATGLMTDRLNVVRDEINDLRSRNIPRGAFRNEHLPSLVSSPKVQSITPAAGQLINGLYPGFGIASATWAPVVDGATPLEVNPAIVLATTPGVLVVLANVEVKSLYLTAGTRDKRVMGMFIIRFRDQTATWRYVLSSEMATHNRNEYPDFDGEAISEMREVHEDVPLMWVTDAAYLASIGVTQVNEIQVCATTHHASATPTAVSMYTRNACITAFLLRGVVLA